MRCGAPPTKMVCAEVGWKVTFTKIEGAEKVVQWRIVMARASAARCEGESAQLWWIS